MVSDDKYKALSVELGSSESLCLETGVHMLQALASPHSLVQVCLQCGRPGIDPWVGKIPGEGKGYPLQYSCLDNSMNRGAWQATVHGVARARHNLVTKPQSYTFISGSWWGTGRPGALRFMGSQRVGHDWVTELNWTEWYKIFSIDSQVLSNHSLILDKKKIHDMDQDFSVFSLITLQFL